MMKNVKCPGVIHIWSKRKSLFKGLRLCHAWPCPERGVRDGDRNKLRASECQWSVLRDFSLPKVQQHLFLEMRPLRTILNTVTPSHPLSACSSFTSYFCLYFCTFETVWGTMWAKKCQEVGSSFPGRKEKKERRPWRFLAVIFQETSEAKCWPRLPTGRVVMVPGDCSQGMWARTEVSWSFVSQKQGRRMGASLKGTRLCKTIFKTSSPWDLLVMPIARVIPDANI